MEKRCVRQLFFCVFLIFGIFPTYLIFTNRHHIFQFANKPHRSSVASQRKVEKIISKNSSSVLLCWIMTAPMNHLTKAVHVKNTWGKRCDILLFMSSQEDKELGTIKLENVKEGRAWLWPKTLEAFKYIFKNYLNQIDWILKADDDTFVIVENLRDFLSSYNSNELHFFGGKFKYTSGKLSFFYFTGGAGYVLSKATLIKFIEEGVPNQNKCSSSGRVDVNKGEDIEIANCLINIGVPLGDTRDEKKRLRFFHYSPNFLLFPWSNFNFFKQHSGWEFKGQEGIADTIISFHYVKPNMMYLLDWMFYHAKRAKGINETNSFITS